MEKYIIVYFVYNVYYNNDRISLLEYMMQVQNCTHSQNIVGTFQRDSICVNYEIVTHVASLALHLKNSGALPLNAYVTQPCLSSAQ